MDKVEASSFVERGARFRSFPILWILARPPCTICSRREADAEAAVAADVADEEDDEDEDDAKAVDGAGWDDDDWLSLEGAEEEKDDEEGIERSPLEEEG